MSHNITIDRSGQVFSPESERMLQAIEANSPLADKRMLWKFNDVYAVHTPERKAGDEIGVRVVLKRTGVSAYTVVREYSKHDHRLYEAYLDNCRAQAALNGVPVVTPQYRWYSSTQEAHKEKCTNRSLLLFHNKINKRSSSL